MLPNQQLSQALSLDSPPTVRQYFEKVRDLLKSGIQFPVELDDVWPIAYGRKEEAVRVLRSEFMQHVDYQSLRKSPGKSKGRLIEYYQLSVPCLEWLIARKVREVFEVYREVFHRVADMAEQAVQQTALVAIVNDLTAKMINLEDKLDRLTKSRERYYKAFVVEKKANIAKEKHDEYLERRDKWRIKFLLYMDRYCKYTAGTPSSVLSEVFKKFEAEYNVILNGQRKEVGECWLDVAYRMGYGQQVWECLVYRLTFSSNVQPLKAEL